MFRWIVRQGPESVIAISLWLLNNLGGLSSLAANVAELIDRLINVLIKIMIAAMRDFVFIGLPPVVLDVYLGPITQVRLAYPNFWVWRNSM